MSKCQYCGKEVGFLRNAHQECKQMHDSGINRIEQMATQAAISQSYLNVVEDTIKKIASESFIKHDALNQHLISAWEQAVSQALDDNVLSEEEENALVNYREHFSLSKDVLDQRGTYTKVVKAGIIREVLEGKIPQRLKLGGVIPFNLQKGETIIWLFQKTPFYEPRTRTSYTGSYSGVSLRIAKGVYFRTGGFKGNPVSTSQLTLIDTGILAITNKHIYYSGSAKSFRVPYKKIISFTPYSDGIGVQRDASTAKHQVFITNDGWFTYNLISNLAQLSDG